MSNFLRQRQLRARLARKVASKAPTNTEATEGDNGYGCACVSADAQTCATLRLGEDAEDRCECLCHQWRQEDDQQ